MDEPDEERNSFYSFLSSSWLGVWINRFAFACGLVFLIVALIQAGH
ncbi:hypothetical protein [Microvirga pudoricolor]|nr:hypothetical protein [Microvirga pudoricolor]MBM6594345.1 hypothetical protein [Microvirga pudoricolor]